MIPRRSKGLKKYQKKIKKSQDLDLLLKQRLNETPKLETDDRNEYFRDYGRVIHSTAFRRLQGKTQIYPGHHSVIRTRLTHTLEVAELAESIYYKYFDNQPGFEYIDLIALRTICLIHDIGHPPFGHKGDSGLSNIIVDKYGEHHFFEGNAQNFRIVNKLSKRQGKEGQDLTIRVLLGIIKKYQKKDKEVTFRENIYREDYSYAEKIGEKLGIEDILSKKIRTIECAIMDRADELAYVTHDLDDAIKNGEFSVQNVISFILDYKDLKQLPTWFISKIKNLETSSNSDDVLRQKLIYKLIQLFIDGIDLNKARKKAHNVRTIEAYLISGEDFLFKKEIEEFRDSLYKEFIYKRFIFTPHVQMYEQKAEKVIKQMFEELNSNTKLLPSEYKEQIDKEYNLQTRIIVDYIAGMTDAYFAEMYNRLFTFQSHNISDKL